jgi:predicted PurR-regulated permease PerM
MVTAHTAEPSLGARLVAAAAAVIVLAGIHAIAPLISILALSILATILLAPVQAELVRRGVPGWAAMLLAVALYIAVLGIAGLLVAFGLAGFVRDLPSYRADLETTLSDASTALGGDGTPTLIDPDAAESVVRGLVDDIVGVLSTVGYSVFIVAYLLLEAPRAADRLRAAFGPTTTAVERGEALANRLRTYVIARAVLGAIAAVLDTILLLALGVPAALLWGVLSFLLSFIPNVGFILALIPPAILGLLVGGLPVALAVVIGYSVINIAIDYVVQPKFVGGSVDLAPVVVTVSLLFWAVVLGPSGALLAVPMTIVAAAAFDAFPESRPLARLLGQGPPPDPRAA